MKSKANGQIKVVVVAMGPPRIVSSVIDDLCHWELLGWKCDWFLLIRRPNISVIDDLGHQELLGWKCDWFLPTAVQLHTKLCGSREELEKTAAFILQTGLRV